MYCVYCGTKLPDEARFCFMCGERVELDHSAENNAANASKCNDEEAADVNEAAGVESPNAFTGTNDGGETANAESQNALAAVNDADETTDNEESASEKTTDASETTDEEPHGESATNEKGHNELEAPEKNDADEDATVNQPDEEARNASKSTDKNTSNEKGANEPEASSKNADGAKVTEESPTPNPTDSPAPGISSDKTTVIPLATPSDKTTILPGFGAEKAALEQEKSDEIAALAALYPDANPAQFCDPTPFEAKSPDITEFIAPMPINGTKPASAESTHYAESPKKKSADKRALLIAIVVIIAALAAAAAFGMSLDISPN